MMGKVFAAVQLLAVFVTLPFRSVAAAADHASQAEPDHLVASIENDSEIEQYLLCIEGRSFPTEQLPQLALKEPVSGIPARDWQNGSVVESYSLSFSEAEIVFFNSAFALLNEAFLTETKAALPGQNVTKTCMHFKPFRSTDFEVATRATKLGFLLGFASVTITRNEIITQPIHRGGEARSNSTAGRYLLPIFGAGALLPEDKAIVRDLLVSRETNQSSTEKQTRKFLEQRGCALPEANAAPFDLVQRLSVCLQPFGLPISQNDF